MKRLEEDFGPGVQADVAKVLHEFAVGVHERHYEWSEGNITMMDMKTYVADQADKIYNVIVEAQNGPDNKAHKVTA